MGLIKIPSKAKGQSMTEYGTIGACVLIPAVAALILLGSNVSKIFDGLFSGSTKTGAVAANAAGSGGSGGGLSGGANPENADSGPGSINQTLNNINGNTLEAYTKSGKAVLTAGGLGVDQLKAEAQEIGAILAKLEAEGYDPDNIGWVKWAADNGYTTADRLEESWANCPPQGSCKDWDTAANARLWAETYATGVKPAYVGTDQLGGQQDDLYNVYNSFKNDPGILGDRPAEKQAITQHLENIISISKTSGAVLVTRTAGTDSDLAVNNNVDYTPYQVEQDVTGIRNESDAICGNGGGANCKQ